MEEKLQRKKKHKRMGKKVAEERYNKRKSGIRILTRKVVRK